MMNISYNSIYSYFTSMSLEEKTAWIAIVLGLIMIMIGFLL